jgi:hypothetical protein
MNNLKFNGEGYPDPTAYGGIKEVVKEEAERDRKAVDLVKVIKFILSSCGFELVERIHFKDTKSGREYK